MESRPLKERQCTCMGTAGGLCAATVQSSVWCVACDEGVTGPRVREPRAAPVAVPRARSRPAPGRARGAARTRAVPVERGAGDTAISMVHGWPEGLAPLSSLHHPEVPCACREINQRTTEAPQRAAPASWRQLCELAAACRLQRLHTP